MFRVWWSLHTCHDEVVQSTPQYKAEIDQCTGYAVSVITVCISLCSKQYSQHASKYTHVVMSCYNTAWHHSRNFIRPSRTLVWEHMYARPWRVASTRWAWGLCRGAGALQASPKCCHRYRAQTYPPASYVPWALLHIHSRSLHLPHSSPRAWLRTGSLNIGGVGDRRNAGPRGECSTGPVWQHTRVMHEVDR